jgi:hypothetical protein
MRLLQTESDFALHKLGYNCSAKFRRQIAFNLCCFSLLLRTIICQNRMVFNHFCCKKSLQYSNLIFKFAIDLCTTQNFKNDVAGKTLKNLLALTICLSKLNKFVIVPQK